MLQKLGLIKYNKRYLLENDNNIISPTYSPKVIKICNYNINSHYNSRYIQNILKNKSCNHNPKLLFNDNYLPKKKEFTQKIDQIFCHNINKFISESTHNVINYNNICLSLIKINHDIDDNILENNKESVYYSPKKYPKSANKLKNSNKTIYKEYIKEIRENNNINNYQIDIEKEINYKNELIKKLNINNNSILKKISLLKNQYNNNLKNSTEIDKEFNKELYNSQNLKKNKEVIDNDILSLKENIIELKNKLSLLNRQQTSINLMLFKEQMENELKKEDISKMNKLIENTKEDIKKIKNEISLIQNKNKTLINTQLNLPFKRKK